MSAALVVFDELEPGAAPPIKTRRRLEETVPLQQDTSDIGRFKLLTPDGVLALPPTPYAVQKIFPREGVAAIYGPSGSGKSFLALDLAVHMAAAASWFGYGLPAPLEVVMLQLEGQGQFRKRIAAVAEVRERGIPPRLRFILDPFNLGDSLDVATLAATINDNGGADVLFVDTLAQASPGLDENSSRDMSTVLANLKYLQQEIGGLVIAVHHTGKEQTRGMRGHSSLFAALDAAIEVTRTDSRREWTVAKAKDEDDGKAHGFYLERVVLGEQAGEEISSCVVRLNDAPVEQAPKQPKGDNQRIILKALGPLFRESGQYGKAGAPPTRPCLRLEDAIEATKGSLVVESKRQPERARLAIQGLTGLGILRHSEGWIWLA